jgi:hypothetical protein
MNEVSSERKILSRRVEYQGAILHGGITPASKFEELAIKLKLSMDEGWISMIDEDGYKLHSYLYDHPDFQPKLREKRLEMLNVICKLAWKTPDAQEAYGRLMGTRLEPGGSKQLYQVHLP